MSYKLRFATSNEVSIFYYKYNDIFDNSGICMVDDTCDDFELVHNICNSFIIYDKDDSINIGHIEEGSDSDYMHYEISNITNCPWCGEAFDISDVKQD